ncbi:S-adenosyl-L-methionine-dependent methyltransferase [Achaetomium macrosporum]|uniref:S-adenosyl-L-methionine-dependent methyltransferase n=1 Tax=Achaetomium macrosporum TaxID=79813 RepID=A0AAN7C2A1_9PEZI|nr:S-adenosyl-L-methionine-dependent methyltransferase [Achaetomium macrosporum]
MPADYEKQSYWHDRFASETAFEWYTSSAAFLNALGPLLDKFPRDAGILHLGSGTSDLHNHLRERGFVNVTNIDYEPLALQRGQQLERNRFGDVRTRYLVADATQLDPKDTYQIAIDKGMADAIACGGTEAVVATAESIRRCLDPDGVWVCLSYSASRFGLKAVQSLFDVQVLSRVPTPKSKPTNPDIFHFCYLLRPRQGVA